MAPVLPVDAGPIWLLVIDCANLVSSSLIIDSSLPTG